MVYGCCILLKGVCELFSAGKWQQYMQCMPNFFGPFVTSLLLSAGWFSSTHTYYFPGLVRAPRSVFHSAACDFATGVNFPLNFFCWGGSQGCGAALCQELVKSEGVLFRGPTVLFPPGP